MVLETLVGISSAQGEGSSSSAALHGGVEELTFAVENQSYSMNYKYRGVHARLNDASNHQDTHAARAWYLAIPSRADDALRPCPNRLLTEASSHVSERSGDPSSAPAAATAINATTVPRRYLPTVFVLPERLAISGFQLVKISTD